jgi:hypothetical protein
LAITIDAIGKRYFYFRIHEVEEKLNNKDKEITEKNEAVATLKNRCKM